MSNKITIEYDKDTMEDVYEYSFYAMQDGKCYWLAVACAGLSRRIQEEIIRNAKTSFGKDVEIDWKHCSHLMHDFNAIYRLD